MASTPTSGPARPGGTVDAALAELDRLDQALATVATSLADLDADPARKNLETGPLTGRTAAAWADASVAISELWAGYTALSDVVTQAKALRDKRRRSDAEDAELVTLVLGQSVVLSAMTMPQTQRTLLAAGQSVTRYAPAQLLDAMARAYTIAREPVDAAAAAWARLLAATAEAATAVDATHAQAATAGAPTTGIDDINRRLQAFMSKLATDPVGCQDADLASITAAIRRAQAELSSAVELIADLTRRAAAAHTLAADIAAAHAEADDAYTHAAEKIDPGQLAAVPPGATLRTALAAVDALAAAGQWTLLGGRLADWTNQAGRHLAAVRSARDASRAALAERGELRGLLDAYRAKAARLGHAEDPALSAAYRHAHGLLYTAPCDLVAARAAVAAYRELLAQAPTGPAGAINQKDR